MCVISMVSDFYNEDWRKKQPDPIPLAPWPQVAPSTLPWNHDTYKLLQEIMEKMKKLDDKLGLPNCEDPKKAEWMKSIEKRIKKLETRK